MSEKQLSLGATPWPFNKGDIMECMEGPMSDTEYEAQHNAEILTKAIEIKKDPVKLKAAALAASKIAEHRVEKTKTFQRVARMAKK